MSVILATLARLHEMKLNKAAVKSREEVLDNKLIVFMIDIFDV